MGYGTADGFASATPAENAALALFNAIDNTEVTWDTMTMGEMLVVNAIYTAALNLVVDLND